MAGLSHWLEQQDIQFQIENEILKADSKVQGIGPDLICCLDTQNERPEEEDEGFRGAPAGGYNKSDNNQVAAAANPAVLSPTARWIQRQPPILAQSHLSILVYLRIGYARLQLPVAILYWMAGGISPQNALDLPTRGVQDNIMAAKSKHSQT
ncbi:hypothetical protein WJX79_001071 [Trebouxia sp. C0005]